MALTQIKYAVKGLYAGPSPASGSHFDGTGCLTTGYNLIKEILRVQEVNYDFNFNRENVSQFGDLATIDQVPTTWPDINLNFSYLQNNVSNENGIGLTISSGQLANALSGILVGVSEDKNYFMAIDEGNTELHNNPDPTIQATPGSIIGFGNVLLNNYVAQGAVGQFPTVNIGAEALNVKIYNIDGSLKPIYANDTYDLHFDDVSSGDRITAGLDNGSWTNSLSRVANSVMSVNARHLSESRRENQKIIADYPRNAIFTSRTTGTDWAGIEAFSD